MKARFSHQLVYAYGTDADGFDSHSHPDRLFNNLKTTKLVNRRSIQHKIHLSTDSEAQKIGKRVGHDDCREQFCNFLS